MGEIIMRNWDLREFRVRVNWPSPIRQVQVLIRRVITPIRGLLNPIRPLLNPIKQVILLISHSRSYPPYRSHLHPPSLAFLSTTLPSSQEHKVKSSLSISPCHHHELTPSAAYGECSIHRVQHTPSAAYAECSIRRVQHTPSAAYAECSIRRVQHTPKIVCCPFILSILSWPLIVASASSIPSYILTATSQFSIRASNIKWPRHVPTVSS